jgi:hypothetical protein
MKPYVNITSMNRLTKARNIALTPWISFSKTTTRAGRVIDQMRSKSLGKRLEGSSALSSWLLPISG